MERTRDILQSLGETKKQQYLVGFAAETSTPLEYGLQKLKKKNLNAIVINNIASKGAGFDGDTNAVTYVNKQERKEEIELASKQEVAEKLMRLIDRDMKDEFS